MSYDTRDPALLKALHDISGKHTSDLSLLLDAVLRKLDGIDNGITLLRMKVDQMSDTNPTLDQAVNDLDAAVTANLTANQTLAADAKQGLNEAADVAKVEGLVGKLNAETAADQAITNPAPVVTVAPAPTATVTVTGQTPSGAPVVDAPVVTGPDAPATQTVSK